jgi:2-polyprenyl-3-methyl-5-hydroxy-6-metoxy-1,4-benzoquinol methylase
LEKLEKTKSQFDKLAIHYENAGFWDFYFKTSAKKVTNLISNKYITNNTLSILDLGCGTGTLLTYLSQRLPSAKLVGLDLSSEMLKQATNKINKFQLKNIDFRNIDVNQFETAEKFDIITCLNSFHHYSNHNQIIKKIHSLLNDNGIFILVDPITNNYLRKAWVYLLKHFLFDEPDVVYFSKKQLLDLFSNSRMIQNHYELLYYFVMLSVWTKRKIT